MLTIEGVTGMSTGLLNQSGSSTGFECVNQAKLLVKSIIDSFKYHPLFFMLRSSVASEDPVYPFAHQLELLGKLFARKPIRVLIGDEIGLGKTVSAIMIIKYLLEAEKIRRILILVPRVLVQQWLSELKRFNLTNIHQLERNTIAGYQTLGFPEGIYLASIDLIKRNEHKVKILNVKWDLIVVDEA
ncbi:MAG: SNF2-related protein, partial [Desulfurococcaceae archaeon]